MIPKLSPRYSRFLEELRPRIRGELRSDDMTRALYATDASLYKMSPIAVLRPRTEDDVVEAVRLAAVHNVSVLPRGGASSLAGQAVGEALVLDFTVHLDRILEVDPAAQTIRAQAGAVIDDVNAALRPHGLNLGPDPASSSRATMGGLVANNSTGTHSLLYGNTVQHIVAMRVVLSDGTIVTFDAADDQEWEQRASRPGREGEIYRGIDRIVRKSRDVIERDTPRHWRRNNGYRIEHLLDGPRNLGQLICGSEGTLGIVLDATLKTVPLPARTVLGIVHFETRERALRSVVRILETNPSAVELFDGIAIEQTRRAPGFADKLTFIEGDPGAVLITEYFGDDLPELQLKLGELSEIMAAHQYGYAVVPAIEPGEIANVWNIRKEGLGLMMGVKGDHKPVAMIEDASVPVEHLADYIEELEELLARTGTRVAMYAHASAGCLHVRPFINTKDAEEVKTMRDIAFGSMELVKKYGGVVSSEHGDGIVRAWLTEPLVGPELYQVYREVKG
ncbi:MAG: FAD-binding oxidoreductase, partial [Bacteroidota bacterium]